MAVERKRWSTPLAISLGFGLLIVLEAFLGANGVGFWVSWLLGMLVFTLSAGLVHLATPRRAIRRRDMGFIANLARASIGAVLSRRRQ